MRLIRHTVRYNDGSRGKKVPKVTVYLTYVKDNEEKLFLVNWILTDKKTGNDYYIREKNNTNHTNIFEETTEENISDDEFIRRIEKHIDKFPDISSKYYDITVKKNNIFYGIIDRVSKNN